MYNYSQYDETCILAMHKVPHLVVITNHRFFREQAAAEIEASAQAADSAQQKYSEVSESYRDLQIRDCGLSDEE